MYRKLASLLWAVEPAIGTCTGWSFEAAFRSAKLGPVGIRMRSISWSFLKSLGGGSLGLARAGVGVVASHPMPGRWTVTGIASSPYLAARQSSTVVGPVA